MTNLAYDRYAFDSRAIRFNDPHKPSVPTICISHSDYDRIHITRRAVRTRFIPAWANNDDQFRHVLAQRCWEYLNGLEGSVFKNQTCRSLSAGTVPENLVSKREALNAFVLRASKNRKTLKVVHISLYP